MANDTPFFDILLVGENGPPLVVGMVTVSHELAEEVADEIREFTGLMKE